MQKNILLEHGAGGRASRELIKDLAKILDNSILNELDDSAVIQIKDKKIAFTTDSYVVNPIFFPGGNIGKLSICGSVNDLSVCGAKPLFISSALIIEEGFDKTTLAGIIKSMKKTANEAGVQIVTGDTKIVEKGKCDKIFITTSGIGEIPNQINLSRDKIRAGDDIIINGSIGDHGFSVINAREEFGFKSGLKSDAACLHRLIAKALSVKNAIKFMRDPTRGGVAAVLNEFVEDMPFGIRIDEDKLPVNKSVWALSEILGIDPLHVGNEGKVIMVVDAKKSKDVLRKIKSDKLGRQAEIIGKVTKENKGKVTVETKLGTHRFLDMPQAEALPRIC